MPYILKNNKIDERYERRFFEIVASNLAAEKIGTLEGLLKLKTEIISGFLSDVHAGKAGIEGFDAVLSLIFSIRRHKGNILQNTPTEILGKSFGCLGDFKKPAEIRLGRFLEYFNYENTVVKKDIALEVMYFCEPHKNPLWTSWVYRPDNGTGCLPYMADFLKRTWDGNPYIMPFSIREMRDETDYLYELSYKNGLGIKPPYGAGILLSYMYSDYVYKMVYAESKSLSIGVPDGFTLMKKLLGVNNLTLPEASVFPATASAEAEKKPAARPS